MKILEQNLNVNNSLCSLYTIKSKDSSDSEYRIKRATSTIKWCILERFKGSVPPLENIRAKYILDLKDSWGNRSQQTSAFWLEVKFGNSLAAKIYKFLLKYECLKPIEPYELLINNNYIVGESTIVYPTNSKSNVAYALDLTDTMVLKRRPIPSYIALARWLAARSTYEHTNLGILHLPLIYGTAWKSQNIVESVAFNWICGILQQEVGGVKYPVIGSHCSGCSAPCKSLWIE